MSLWRILNSFALPRCDIPYHTTSFIHLLHWKDGTGRRLGQAPGEVGRRTDEGGLPKAVRRLGEVFGETGKYSVLTSGELIIHHSSSYDEYTQFKCTALDTLTGVKLSLYCIFDLVNIVILGLRMRFISKSRILVRDVNLTYNLH